VVRFTVRSSQTLNAEPVTYQPRDTRVTSRVMSAIKSKDNKTEVALRKELHRRGYRYRVHARNILGSPDIAFTRAKVAVFVDGDFWHGRILREEGEAAFRERMKTKRRDWWREKLQKNIDRDREVTLRLRAEGWTVLRFWESDITCDIVKAADAVGDLIDAARPTKEMDERI
jgi:DNA mismatch endonuclease, patch repair protein